MLFPKDERASVPSVPLWLNCLRIMPLVADLQSRGLVHQTSVPDLDALLTKLLQSRPIAAYAGFDPTADSLHVGNFVAILGLIYAQRNGIRPIAVVGGATGLIGDPGGRTTERQLQSKEDVAKNVQGIRRVLEKFLDFNDAKAPAIIISNLDWFGPMSAIDFLRDVGKHFRVGSMLAKDSVRSRMDASDEGMSYTEFSYQLLQGYDFYRLYKDQNCVLQLGGSDQWGNITAGTDLIRKLEGESGNAFALTMPLITTSSGAKFGKSEGNAVWLTADRTSVFDFYQFWLRTLDGDVVRYLKYFTFMPLDHIEHLMASHLSAPEKRTAQRELARLMTTLVHGSAATEQALSASETLYGSEKLDAAAFHSLTEQGVPSININLSRLQAGISIVDACVDTGLAKSKGEARRLIQQGGLYMNNVKVTSIDEVIRPDNLIASDGIVLRAGKKNYRLIRLGDPASPD
jgi:tyrosyl-tRNA synthetase